MHKNNKSQRIHNFEQPKGTYTMYVTHREEIHRKKSEEKPMHLIMHPRLSLIALKIEHDFISLEQKTSSGQIGHVCREREEVKPGR